MKIDWDVMLDISCWLIIAVAVETVLLTCYAIVGVFFSISPPFLVVKIWAISSVVFCGIAVAIFMIEEVVR